MTPEEKANPNFPTDPHSVYFDLLGTSGLVGLGAFLFYLLSAFFAYLRLWYSPLTPEQRSIVLTGLGAWVCFIVGSAFDSHFFHTQTLMGTVFFLALGQSVRVPASAK
jgi:O-antigen ligase